MQDKDYEFKKRICIYMPENLDENLKKLAKEKKLSKNKLSLEIISQYIDSMKEVGSI